jgi:hypothetical protein
MAVDRILKLNLFGELIHVLISYKALGDVSAADGVTYR